MNARHQLPEWLRKVYTKAKDVSLFSWDSAARSCFCEMVLSNPIELHA